MKQSKEQLKEWAGSFNEKGFLTQVIQEGTLNRLRILLRKDAKGRDLYGDLFFIPNVEHLDILQFFILLPFPCKPQSKALLSRFIALVNEQLPVGHFNLNEDSGLIYYRHLQPHLKDQWSFELVAEILNMLNMMADILSDSLEEVAEGNLNYEDAKRLFIERMKKLLQIPMTQ